MSSAEGDGYRAVGDVTCAEGAAGVGGGFALEDGGDLGDARLRCEQELDN